MTEVERLLPVDEALERLCENEARRSDFKDAFTGVKGGFYLTLLTSNLFDFPTPAISFMEVLSNPELAAWNIALTVANYSVVGSFFVKDVVNLSTSVIEKTIGRNYPAEKVDYALVQDFRGIFSNKRTIANTIYGRKIRPVDKLSEIEPGQAGFINGFSLTSYQERPVSVFRGARASVSHNGEEHDVVIRSKIAMSSNAVARAISGLETRGLYALVNRSRLNLIRMYPETAAQLSDEEKQEILESTLGEFSFSGVAIRSRFGKGFKVIYCGPAVTDSYTVTKKKEQLAEKAALEDYSPSPALTGVSM